MMRAGLTVEQAAHRYSALLSPTPHLLLTIEMGWTAVRHQQRVTGRLEADVPGGQPEV